MGLSLPAPGTIIQLNTVTMRQKYAINTDKFNIVDLGGEDTAIVNTDFVKITAGIEIVIYADGVKKMPYWVSALVWPSAHTYSCWLDYGAFNFD